MTGQCIVTAHVKIFLSIKLEIIRAVIQEQTIDFPPKLIGTKFGAVFIWPPRQQQWVQSTDLSSRHSSGFRHSCDFSYCALHSQISKQSYYSGISLIQSSWELENEGYRPTKSYYTRKRKRNVSSRKTDNAESYRDSTVLKKHEGNMSLHACISAANCCIYNVLFP